MSYETRQAQGFKRLKAAYRKGYDAGHDGVDASECPYTGYSHRAQWFAGHTKGQAAP